MQPSPGVLETNNPNSRLENSNILNGSNDELASLASNLYNNLDGTMSVTKTNKSASTKPPKSDLADTGNLAL